MNKRLNRLWSVGAFGMWVALMPVGCREKLQEATAPATKPVAAAPAAAPSSSVLDKWDELVALNKGAAGAQARLEFLRKEVLDQGLEGADLLDFIVALHDRRQHEQVEWLLENAKKQLFVGKAGAATRAALDRVKDDKLRDQLYFQTGYCFAGAGLKEYLAGLATAQAQARFLTGYCCGVAETDAIRGLDEFRDLRPDRVNYLGLKEVVHHFQVDADFEKAGMRYGDDFTPSNSLAKGVRRELLRRWAKFHPEQAGKFVIDHPELVAVDQIGSVLDTWLATAPEAAGTWVLGLSAGVHQDYGCERLATHWQATQPAKAWQFVTKIVEAQKRTKLATAVFEVWSRKDMAAAKAAWGEMFPVK